MQFYLFVRKKNINFAKIHNIKHLQFVATDCEFLYAQTLRNTGFFLVSSDLRKYSANRMFFQVLTLIFLSIFVSIV